MNGRDLVQYIDSICDKVNEIKSIKCMMQGIEVCEPSCIHVEKGIFELADALGKKIEVRHYGDNSVEHLFDYRGITFFCFGEVDPW